MLFSCTKEDPVPAPDRPVMLECVKPDYLKAGDRVALISPSYYTPMENVEKTTEVLRGWGLEPVVGPNVGRIDGGQYVGTVEERISDIRWALSDPTIKAIICNRGGYGSIHGTMSSFLAAGGTDDTSTLMRDILLGIVPEYKVKAHPQNIPGSATGTLVGGNICTFAPNLGTQADATAGKDIILFIEEVEESMHNIDRQMRILQMNGALDRCKGIILGEFSGCGTEFKDESGQTISIEEMLHGILAPYNIPVLCGFPAGHGDVNLPLIMGAPVTIDVSPAGATISFGIDGQRQEITASAAARSAGMPLSTRMVLAGKRAELESL